MIHVLRAPFLCIATLLSACSRKEPSYTVTLDLAKPTDYSGIPSAKWFPMGRYEFCAIQGAVTAHIRLPDGKLIEDKFSIVYVDRDSDGILRFRGDSQNGSVSHKVAPTRLHSELHNWAEESLASSELEQKEAKIQAWMKTKFSDREMWEGFSVQRPLYRIGFGFFGTYSTRNKGFGYSYDVNLREPKR
jgi:hypothetical protein